MRRSEAPPRARIAPLPGSWGALVAVALLSLGSVGADCGGFQEPDNLPPLPGPSVRMSFARVDFWDAPFPSDDLLVGAGDARSVDLTRYPNPDRVDLIEQCLVLLGRDAHGFGVSSAAYLALDGAIDPAALPDVSASVTDAARVFLFDVERGTRHPARISFLADGGPFGAPNQLALLPVQGIPLRPKARYAAVVRRGLIDPAGRPLSVSADMAALAAGQRPDALDEGAYASYAAALAALAAAGVPAAGIAGLGVYTTDDPTAGLRQFFDDAVARGVPKPDAPLVPAEVYPDFCVYQTTLHLPDYQQGTPPYSQAADGGGWALTNGAPTAPGLQQAKLWLTIPRRPMPAAGYPTTLFVRTGGGGDRPLVDRGVCADTHYTTPITPGTGPALELSRAGFAGVQVDGPLGGLRNPNGADEEFLIFNVFNAAALRDNIRESALELALMARVIPTLTVDASACPGADPHPVLDGGHLAIMGHSMGAFIAPLVTFLAPELGAMVLSGAGGSYVENVLWKVKPVKVEPLAEDILAYNVAGRTIVEGDPALNLVQWTAESSDPPVYDGAFLGAAKGPRHALMVQGIVDHYILPEIANPVSLSLGLDLAGDELAASVPELEGETRLTALLPLVGRHQLPLPVRGNQAMGHATAVVVQAAGDAIEDGHEAIFQTDPPKQQYRCFLRDYGLGKTPTVIVPRARDDGGCPAP